MCWPHIEVRPSISPFQTPSILADLDTPDDYAAGNVKTSNVKRED